MGKLLDELSNYDGPRGRIFSVARRQDGLFELREECDCYFTAVLTAGELRQLGQELIEAAADGQTDQKE
jgi:hypothetical protein